MTRVLTILTLLLALIGGPVREAAGVACESPVFPMDQSHVVLDDGNNLRQPGWPDPMKAPVIGRLDAWDEVRVLERRGKWATVATPDGREGVVNARCLAAYADIVAGRREVEGFPAKDNCAFSPDWKTRFSADLDGSGKASSLTLKCLPWKGCSNHGLSIAGPDGRILYSGPQKADSPLFFCLCDYGVYWPEAFGDMDGDGRAELLAANSPSDVSVGTFYLGRWNGAGFDTLRRDLALIEDPARPGFFAFAPPPENGDPAPAQLRWIMSFSGLDKAGKLVGSVYQYRKTAGGQNDLFSGEAVFSMGPDGLTLLSWRKPFKKSV